MAIRIHETADVSNLAVIGEGTSVWHQAQIRENARLGKNCVIGKGVYIDFDVCLGDNVKVQNYVSIFHGVTLEDGVFVGPHVCFTNDLRPRAINPDGSMKSADDWVLSQTLVKRGAALGANSTIRCGITIGEWAMVGSGSVVTKDIPDYGLVYGNPARLRGFVCPCGTQVEKAQQYKDFLSTKCPDCGQEIQIPKNDWEQIK